MIKLFISKRRRLFFIIKHPLRMREKGDRGIVALRGQWSMVLDARTNPVLLPMNRQGYRVYKDGELHTLR